MFHVQFALETGAIVSIALIEAILISQFWRIKHVGRLVPKIRKPGDDILELVEFHEGQLVVKGNYKYGKKPLALLATVLSSGGKGVEEPARNLDPPDN